MKEINVTQKGTTLIAIIDDCDYGLISSRKWSMASHGYPQSATTLDDGRRSIILMHRLIMNAQKGMQVDHINRNKLDNRRCNLRLCSAQQNGCNRGADDGYTSRFKGVRFDKISGKWVADFKTNGKTHRIGLFENEEDAARYYDAYVYRYHGEFAYLNFGTPDFNVDVKNIAKDTKRRHNCQSIYRGVTRFRGAWRATCQAEGKSCHIGRFETEIAAARAYDAKIKLLGLKRPLNFPD